MRKLSYLILLFLLFLGFGGKRHQISHCRLDLAAYKRHKAAREQRLSQWMHDQGIGV